MKRAVAGLASVVLTLTVLACSGGGDGSDQTAADTLTRRQKDSIISTLPIPGAAGVGKALQAADSASARARVHDSLAGIRR